MLLLLFDLTGSCLLHAACRADTRCTCTCVCRYTRCVTANAAAFFVALPVCRLLNACFGLLETHGACLVKRWCSVDGLLFALCCMQGIFLILTCPVWDSFDGRGTHQVAGQGLQLQLMLGLCADCVTFYELGV
jgi:hypothetical protein